METKLGSAFEHSILETERILNPQSYTQTETQTSTNYLRHTTSPLQDNLKEDEAFKRSARKSRRYIENTAQDRQHFDSLHKPVHSLMITAFSFVHRSTLQELESFLYHGKQEHVSCLPIKLLSRLSS